MCEYAITKFILEVWLCYIRKWSKRHLVIPVANLFDKSLAIFLFDRTIYKGFYTAKSMDSQLLVCLHFVHKLYPA